MDHFHLIEFASPSLFFKASTSFILLSKVMHTTIARSNLKYNHLGPNKGIKTVFRLLEINSSKYLNLIRVYTHAKEKFNNLQTLLLHKSSLIV